MAVVGTATLNVVPKFPGLSKSVRTALKGIDVDTPGKGAGISFGNSFAGGMGKTGAVAGAAAALANRALGAMSASLSDAISRFDTLNNYPKVMESLGYEAGVVESSLALMDKRLQGLPTSLDSMVSTVQGISVATGDLDRATRAGLALNDMLLASGSSAQLTSAAVEQFRQMLSKGKPDMQDWKSLVQAMPGQMDQLAKSMLGPTAGANDLYAALGGGGAEAAVTMDELLDAMIRLDAEGGEGVTSFAEQAKSATGGVETSMANLRTSVVRGLSGIMDEVGKDGIAGALGDLKGAVDGAFKAARAAVSAAMPAVSGLLGAVRQFAPQIAVAAGSFAAFRGAASVVQGVVPKVGGLVEALRLAAGGAGTLSESLGLVGVKLNPVALGVTAAAAAAALAVTAFVDWKTKTDNARKATEGLDSAIDRAKGIKGYGGTLDGIGESAKRSAKSIDELNEATAKAVDRMNENTDAAKSQTAELNTAQQAINEYAGRTDLSADAQGRLEWAVKLVNDQLGLNISSQDVAIGRYTDQDGAVRNLTESVNGLIEAKKREIELDALSQSYGDILGEKKSAAEEYANAFAGYDDKKEEIRSRLMSQPGHSGYLARPELLEAAVTGEADAWLKGYSDNLRKWESAAREVAEAIGDVTRSASDGATELDKWGRTLSDGVTALLERNAGANGLGMLKEDLEALGVSAGQLAGKSEGDLMRLANAYDGTAASIVGALEDIGVEVDEAARSHAKAAEEIRAAIEGWGTDLNGIDVGLFSEKLAEAGVSTEELSRVGSLNLSQLAASCGGSMDAMVWYVRHYNDVPILDKEGRVQVDAAELVDAQGRVHEWNGSELVDKETGAAVDDASLIDAQGNLWRWNGSKLMPQRADGTVYGNMREAIEDRDNWNSGRLLDKSANGFVNIVRRVTDFFGNAAGGIRLNAAGGYRLHAGGAIAARAVPLDIVGEAGAEAIVPLTNRRYAQPFADLIAERVNAGRPAAGTTIGELHVHVDQMASIEQWRGFVSMLHAAKAMA